MLESLGYIVVSQINYDSFKRALIVLQKLQASEVGCSGGANFGPSSNLFSRRSNIGCCDILHLKQFCSVGTRQLISLNIPPKKTRGYDNYF